MPLPEDVVYGVTPGHLAAHNALHGRRNADGLTPTLPTTVTAGTTGHDQHHAAMKTWFDGARSTVLPDFAGELIHELIHEALAIWDNARATVGQIRTYQETDLTPTGVWEQGTAEKYSRATGAALTFTFTGDRFIVHGITDTHHGIMGVQVDTGPVVDADQYAAARVENVAVYTSPTLTNGPHTVRLTVTGTKNPASTDFVITIDRVDAYVTDGTGGTTPPVVIPPPIPPGTAGFVTQQGTQLYRNGQPYFWTGLNSFTYAYQTPEAGPVTRSQWQTLFNTVMKPGMVMRVWCFPGGDRTRFAQTVEDAANAGILIMPCLSNGLADFSMSKNSAYWNGGWRTQLDSGKTLEASINELVPQYKNSTTIIGWECSNEPSSSQAANGAFMGDVATLIRSLDSNHLVFSGSDQAYDETNAQNWLSMNLGQGRGPTVVSTHDYEGGSGENSWGSKSRPQAFANGLALYSGEFGKSPEYNFRAMSASDIAGKIARHKTLGYCGILAWDFYSFAHTQQYAAQFAAVKNGM